MRTVNNSFTSTVLPTVGGTNQELNTFGIGQSDPYGSPTIKFLAKEDLGFLLTESGANILVT